MELGSETMGVFRFQRLKGLTKSHLHIGEPCTCTLWNDLANNIKSITGHQNFKTAIKTFFFFFFFFFLNLNQIIFLYCM